MKKFYLMAVAALMCACGKQTCVISGNVSEMGDMAYLLDAKRNAIDSVAVTDGSFTLTREYTEPMRCYLSDNSDISEANLATMVFIEPGKITVQSGDNGLYAYGTPSNDAYLAYNKAGLELNKEYDAEGTSPERLAELEKEYDDLLVNAVKDNFDNIFGLYEFTSLSYDLDGKESVEYLANFTEEMQATETWKSMMESAQKKLLVDVGQQYIDFTQKTPEGEDVSLKSVVEKEGNKYVLLDFWASWCGPCMGEVPYLLKDYAQYHDKGFEIFGSSLDRTAERWIAAIKDKEMNWVHVSDLKYWDNAAADMYAVRSIPANFLIDCSTGKIVARNLRGEALGRKLAELLD